MKQGNINQHPYAFIFFEFDLKIFWKLTPDKKNQERNILNGFQMIKNSYSIDITCESQDFLQKLKEKTSILCFSLNFYDDYKMLKPIGKGISAMVYKIMKID